MRSENSGLFRNTLTADHMYSCHNRRNFPKQVQTPLSQNPQGFSQIFITFLQSTQNFPHFEKKDELHNLNIWEVFESEKCGF